MYWWMVDSIWLVLVVGLYATAFLCRSARNYYASGTLPRWSSDGVTTRFAHYQRRTRKEYDRAVGIPPESGPNSPIYYVNVVNVA